MQFREARGECQGVFSQGTPPKSGSHLAPGSLYPPKSGSHLAPGSLYPPKSGSHLAPGSLSPGCHGDFFCRLFHARRPLFRRRLFRRRGSPLFFSLAFEKRIYYNKVYIITLYRDCNAFRDRQRIGRGDQLLRRPEDAAHALPLAQPALSYHPHQRHLERTAGAGPPLPFSRYHPGVGLLRTHLSEQRPCLAPRPGGLGGVKTERPCR